MSKPLHLQDRCLRILTELGEVAILDTPTIHDRHFADDASGRACFRRLRAFRAHDLIQTYHLSVVRTDRPGRMPALHRLTPEGAELVEQETGVRGLRTSRSDPPKPNTLLHRLGMAKLVLAMNDACQLQHLPKPEWLLEYDAYPHVEPNAKLKDRYLLCREFPTQAGPVRRCWPDAACVLTIPAQDRNWRLVLLWEYDRATETRGQIADKGPGYEALLAGGAWQQFFPHPSGVRIMFVVPSRQRLATVSDALKHSPIASHVRLAIAGDIQPTTFLTAPIWRTVSGDDRPLLPPPTV